MNRKRHIYNLFSQFIVKQQELNVTPEEAAVVLEAHGLIEVDRSVRPWRYSETDKMKAIPRYDFPARILRLLVDSLSND